MARVVWDLARGAGNSEGAVPDRTMAEPGTGPAAFQKVGGAGDSLDKREPSHLSVLAARAGTVGAE